MNKNNVQLIAAVWVLSWIPLVVCFGGLLWSADVRPFLLMFPFSLVETFLTTMLMWRK